MSKPHAYAFIPRKPVPPEPELDHLSLHRTLTRSRSSLWRGWSPGLPSFSEYERTAYKFPWLQDPDNLYSRDNLGSRHPDIILEHPGPTDRSHLLSCDDSAQAGPSMIPPEEKSVHEHGINSDDPEDPNLVTWSGPSDPMNPKNWPKYKKWTATILVSCFTFISPVSSTMLAPALDTIADDFDVKSDIETYLLMSIFLLAYAVGPFVLAPLSEMYGRVVVLQSANMFYLIFNTVCGFSASKEQMLAFRFLSGLGGSAPQALGGGVLSDCWRAEERGTATAIYSLAPFLGPAVGPIAAGYLTQYLSWRWIFWTVSIADAVVQILAFLFLSETYAPKILATKAKGLRKATGNNDLRTEYERPDRTFGQTLRKNLIRPFRMLFTQPALQITALYRAYLYGLMYLVLASFPFVWSEQYDQEPGPASLNYISLGVGFVIGLQISGPLIDKVYRKLKSQNNDIGLPEFRIPLMFPTAVVTPIGLLLYGIAAHFKVHWIVPNIGAGILAAGLILSFQCVQTYVIDSYEKYAASAAGAAAFVRTMAGFSFPLFAPRLYDALGIAWGNGLLAGIVLVMGIVVPAVMWKWGGWLRGRSQYCTG
ncbi:MFS multidrug transporter [Colletotrichum karsti]|uniref:MFS multidrug transporter n=1 Tax=Colletotrichum karsti TaxID=1095194 RepID=A0A9P6ICA1_9PEZI|nr:MFS multidrug transporter [Colletotrichum karsti]KAF9880189.1 MFS multidrug transporter [Colletotrichum karsti]